MIDIQRDGAHWAMADPGSEAKESRILRNGIVSKRTRGIEKDYCLQLLAWE